MSFIIPAIDLMDGSCVRLTEGVYDTSKVYSPDPLEVAKQFQAVGCTRLHLVDLDGARKGEPCNLGILERIASETDLQIDFSGGLRTRGFIQTAFDAGASFVCTGSLAVKEPQLFCEYVHDFGSSRVILSADVRGELLAIKGWEEQTKVSIYSLLEELIEGCSLERIIVTDISKDGRLEGPAFDLYAALRKKFPVLDIIASGGVHAEEDVRRLRELSLGGVIVGKAIYEGAIPYESLGVL